MWYSQLITCCRIVFATGDASGYRRRRRFKRTTLVNKLTTRLTWHLLVTVGDVRLRAAFNLTPVGAAAT